MPSNSISKKAIAGAGSAIAISAIVFASSASAADFEEVKTPENTANETINEGIVENTEKNVSIDNPSARIPENIFTQTNPDIHLVKVGSSLTINVLENDVLSDDRTWDDVVLLNPNFQTVKNTSVDNGSFIVNSDNSVTFTPDEDSFGETTSIDYLASDSMGEVVTGTITVTVIEDLMKADIGETVYPETEKPVKADIGETVDHTVAESSNSVESEKDSSFTPVEANPIASSDTSIVPSEKTQITETTVNDDLASVKVTTPEVDESISESSEFSDVVSPTENTDFVVEETIIPVEEIPEVSTLVEKVDSVVSTSVDSANINKTDGVSLNSFSETSFKNVGYHGITPQNVNTGDEAPTNNNGIITVVGVGALILAGILGGAILMRRKGSRNN